MKRLQQTKVALGSDALLTLIVGDNEGAAAIFTELWQEIHLFEATFSRFQSDSELTYVNQGAGERTEASLEFLALARATKRMAEQTGGLYNPFVLPKLQAAGYKGSW